MRVTIRGIAGQLWIVCLLSYSFLLLLLLLPGAPRTPAIFLIPFYLFVPGHALTKVFFPNLNIFESTFLSMVLSVALLVGIKGAIRTFRLAGLLSELPILVAISAISLVARLVSSK